MADLTAPGGFAADDGAVPPALVDVLARRARGEAGQREVVAVLAHERLLVPLLEVGADLLEGDDADPCAGQDRAVAAVSMRTERGTVGLAFTGMPPLRAWDARARPLPVPAIRVAAALVQEGALGLVVDPAGPAACRLGPVALGRLAGGGAWPPPWEDEVVRAAVVGELAPVLASGEVQVRLARPASEDAGLVVAVRLPGTSPDVAARRVRVIADRLASCTALRDAYDGVLAVRLVA